MPLFPTFNDDREFVKLDENSDFITARVELQDISTAAVFGGATTSTSSNSIAYGIKTFTLDTDDGKIIPGVGVEMQADDHDAFMYGNVISKSTSVSPAQITVLINKISSLTGTYSNWDIQITNDNEQFAPIVAYSSTSVDIPPTDTFDIVIQASKNFEMGSIILLHNVTDASKYITAQVIDYDSGTGDLTLAPLYWTAADNTATWIVSNLTGGLYGGTGGGISARFSGNTSTVRGLLIQDDGTNSSDHYLKLAAQIPTVVDTLTFSTNGDATLTITGDATLPASNTVLVESGSFPAANNLDIAIPSGYSDILMSWTGMSSNTATRIFRIQVSVDGGSSYITTGYVAVNMNSTAGTVVAGPSPAVMANITAMTAAQTSTGSAVIYGYETSCNKMYTGVNESTAPERHTTIGHLANTSAITHVRFTWNSTGNFDAGTYAVWVK